MKSTVSPGERFALRNCSFIDRVTQKAALSFRKVPMARWDLDGHSLAISAFDPRKPNSQQGHKELVHSKATKATKTEGFFTEANEGLPGPSTFGISNLSLAWVRILYFVAFAALL